MRTIPTPKNQHELAARLLEIICCGDCHVSRLCELEHLPAPEIEKALRHLQAYGYVERTGDMVHLKDSNTTTAFCGHLKHPAMGRILFEFSTPASADQIERDAAAFSALVVSLNQAGVEIQYIETTTAV